MADIGRTELARLVRLLESAKELHERLGLVLGEIDLLLEGRAGLGAKMKAIMAGFDTVWCSRYAPGQVKGYIWSGKRDGPLCKRLAQALSVEEVMKRAVNYIRDETPFFVKNRHTFPLFAQSINQHAEAAAEPEPGPIDCRHTPRCQSDAAHTRRRMRELGEPTDAPAS
jgi:hypothetical protein